MIAVKAMEPHSSGEGVSDESEDGNERKKERIHYPEYLFQGATITYIG